MLPTFVAAASIFDAQPERCFNDAEVFSPRRGQARPPVYRRSPRDEIPTCSSLGCVISDAEALLSFCRARDDQDQSHQTSRTQQSSDSELRVSYRFASAALLASRYSAQEFR